MILCSVFFFVVFLCLAETEEYFLRRQVNDQTQISRFLCSMRSIGKMFSMCQKRGQFSNIESIQRKFLSYSLLKKSILLDFLGDVNEKSNQKFNVSDFKYLISKQECSRNSSAPYFVTLVHSSPTQFKTRAACHETWVHSDPRTKTYFLVVSFKAISSTRATIWQTYNGFEVVYRELSAYQVFARNGRWRLRKCSSHLWIFSKQ